MENEKKFKWEKALPRKYAFMREPFDIDIFQKAYDENAAYMAYTMRITKRLREEAGVPPFQGQFAYFPSGVGIMTGAMRGMKGTAIDMRKDKELFKEVLNYFDETAFKPAINFFKNK